MTLRFRGPKGRFQKRNARRKQRIEFWEKGKLVKSGRTQKWKEEGAERFRQRVFRVRRKRPGIRPKKVPKGTLGQLTERQNLNIRNVEKAQKEFELEAVGKDTIFVKVTLRMNRSYTETKRQGATIRRGWKDGRKKFTAKVQREKLSPVEEEILAELRKAEKGRKK